MRNSLSPFTIAYSRYLRSIKTETATATLVICSYEVDLMAMESLLSWMCSVETYETVHMVTDGNGYGNSKVLYVCFFPLLVPSQNWSTTHLPMIPLALLPPLPLPSLNIWTVSYVCTEPIHDDKDSVAVAVAVWTSLYLTEETEELKCRLLVDFFNCQVFVVDIQIQDIFSVENHMIMHQERDISRFLMFWIYWSFNERRSFRQLYCSFKQLTDSRCHSVFPICRDTPVDAPKVEYRPYCTL